MGKKLEVIKLWREERIDEVIPGLMPLAYISSPFSSFFPPVCFLRRLTLLKILTVLKETHRQVGTLEPRPQGFLFWVFFVGRWGLILREKHWSISPLSHAFIGMCLDQGSNMQPWHMGTRL